jgi:hypothetical protein
VDETAQCEGNRRIGSADCESGSRDLDYSKKLLRRRLFQEAAKEED